MAWQASACQASINCFTGPPSDNFYVTVNDAPDPAVAGDQAVCKNDMGIVYSTEEIIEDTYNWEVSGGTIATGAGTHEVTVNWGNPGTGYVKVTEIDPEGCDVTTANFEVVIDNCEGIGDDNGTSFSIYPNPVKDELVIRFAGQLEDNRVVVVNQLGQVVFDHMTGGSKQYTINTSSLSQGVYMLRIYGTKGVSERKVIKVE